MALSGSEEEQSLPQVRCWAVIVKILPLNKEKGKWAKARLSEKRTVILNVHRSTLKATLVGPLSS